jgi:hypothetical protein
MGVAQRVQAYALGQLGETTQARYLARYLAGILRTPEVLMPNGFVTSWYRQYFPA